MRYRGKEYTGAGVTVAVVDSGLNMNHPTMEGAYADGWGLQLGATGHALLSSSFYDDSGHGTMVAGSILAVAPDVRLLAIKIMGGDHKTSAELMAAGIETAAKNGARIINLSLGTPNMGKALLLRDCISNAVKAGCLVISSAHPKGERTYPADLPEAVGVSSHLDCQSDRYYYFSHERFPKSEWGALSGKFLAHGRDRLADGSLGKYRGCGTATAHISGLAACVASAMPDSTPQQILEVIKNQALIPVPEFGYN
jgi:subtilisin family serine protease